MDKKEIKKELLRDLGVDGMEELKESNKMVMETLDGKKFEIKDCVTSTNKKKDPEGELGEIEFKEDAKADLDDGDEKVEDLSDLWDDALLLEES